MQSIARRFTPLIAVLALAIGGGGAVAAPAFATGDATTAPGETCPNEGLEGFREYLPDCRGYEMVTVPFTDGYKNSNFIVSPSGSRILEGSKGAYSGALGAFPQALYQVDRTSSGWATAAATPPASQFSEQHFLAASPDLGTTLWLMRESTESVYAENFYLRDGAGTITKIGSLVPPADVTGPAAGEFGALLNAGNIFYDDASADLSHVFFSIQAGGPLWPGDTTSQSPTNTIGRSLYEYRGTGAKVPSLVGLNNEGRLISDCETSLGSTEYSDVYNAVSANGEVVFFTAEENSHNCYPAPEVNEVYARLAGEDTVAISEPSAADCTACQTGVKASAVFAGASEDGSEVFFTTPQELLPGAVGNNLYEYDFDAPPGMRVSLVSSGLEAAQVDGVARVSEDGSHVYFVANGALTAEANGQGMKAASNEPNMYVYERDAAFPRGRLRFVATLATSDHRDWNSIDIRPVQATPDGEYVVFISKADLTVGDTNSEEQVFEYDAEDGELVRVSANDPSYPEGAASANAERASIPPQSYAENVSPSQAETELAVSDDGSTVEFTSGAVLTAAAAEAAVAPRLLPGGLNVYEYHSSGALSNARVWWLADNATEKISVSPDGSNLFFQTVDPLVSSDVDTQLDTYDARVDGGFPPVVKPAECTGETCQGSPSSSPSFGAPGSVSASGGGNLSAPAVPAAAVKPPPKPKAKPKPKHCKRGTTLKRGKCVKSAHKSTGRKGSKS